MSQTSDLAIETVEKFLAALESNDPAGAVELLHDDARYINVPLPAIKGRAKIDDTLTKWLGRNGAALEVEMHSIAADDHGTVLTERTDILVFGPVRISIWVCGRFDTVGGRITLWKDYFSWTGFALATLRGIAGIALPFLRAK